MPVERGNVKESVMIRVTEQGPGYRRLFYCLETVLTVTKGVTFLLDRLQSRSSHVARAKFLRVVLGGMTMENRN